MLVVWHRDSLVVFPGQGYFRLFYRVHFHVMTHKSVYLFLMLLFACFSTEWDDFLVEKTVFTIIKLDAYLQVTIGDTFGFFFVQSTACNYILLQPLRTSYTLRSHRFIKFQHRFIRIWYRFINFDINSLKFDTLSTEKTMFFSPNYLILLSRFDSDSLEFDTDSLEFDVIH